jgi:nucleotide-binding universal stress UspA family protein
MMTDSTTAHDGEESSARTRLHRSWPKCIVVPLDGSAVAERALPVAITLANATGAELRAAHVYVPLPRGTDVHGLFDYATSVDAQLEHEAAAYVRDVRARHSSSETAPSVLHVDRARARPLTNPFGEATRTVSALERYAHRHGASLFVMTSHGRGGFSRAWIGNVADSLIRGTGVPVLIVRPNEGSDISGSFRNIIVAVDGSSLGESVIPVAMGLAAARDARLTLVRVITIRAAVPRSTLRAQIDVHDLQAQRDEAEGYLADLKGRISAEGLIIETRVVDEPVTILPDLGPARALLELADSSGADLIALSTHGRTGFRRWMLGSVADKIVRGAAIATLVVRGEHHRHSPATAPPSEV